MSTSSLDQYAHQPTAGGVSQSLCVNIQTSERMLELQRAAAREEKKTRHSAPATSLKPQMRQEFNVVSKSMALDVRPSSQVYYHLFNRYLKPAARAQRKHRICFSMILKFHCCTVREHTTQGLGSIPPMFTLTLYFAYKCMRAFIRSHSDLVIQRCISPPPPPLHPRCFTFCSCLSCFKRSCAVRCGAP